MNDSAKSNCKNETLDLVRKMKNQKDAKIQTEVVRENDLPTTWESCSQKELADIAEHGTYGQKMIALRYLNASPTYYAIERRGRKWSIVHAFEALNDAEAQSKMKEYPNLSLISAKDWKRLEKIS